AERSAHQALRLRLEATLAGGVVVARRMRVAGRRIAGCVVGLGYGLGVRRLGRRVDGGWVARVLPALVGIRVLGLVRLVGRVRELVVGLGIDVLSRHPALLGVAVGLGRSFIA